jgi:hypothetical protein
MLSVQLPAMLLFAAASVATAGCGSHPSPGAGMTAAQPSTMADVAGTPNGNATIELVPGQRFADSLAESTHAAAMARCDQLGAAAREACRDQADVEYQSVLTRVMQLGSIPSPPGDEMTRFGARRQQMRLPPQG